MFAFFASLKFMWQILFPSTPEKTSWENMRGSKEPRGGRVGTASFWGEGGGGLSYAAGGTFLREEEGKEKSFYGKMWLGRRQKRRGRIHCSVFWQQHIFRTSTYIFPFLLLASYYKRIWHTLLWMAPIVLAFLGGRRRMGRLSGRWGMSAFGSGQRSIHGCCFGFWPFSAGGTCWQTAEEGRERGGN